MYTDSVLPDQSQVSVFITFSACGEEGSFYFQSLFSLLILCPILLLTRLSAGHPDILSLQKHEICAIPSPISVGEFAAFQISNEIRGLFVMQPWSLLWSEVRKGYVNSVASSNCHSMSVEGGCINFHNSIFGSLRWHRKQMLYILVNILNLRTFSYDSSCSEFS